MLTTAGDTEDAEGVESAQSDERGRTTMTADAERWVRFANLRLRMLTTPSSSPRAKVAFMCGLPNRRTVVWSGDLGNRQGGHQAEFPAHSGRADQGLPLAKLLDS